MDITQRHLEASRFVSWQLLSGQRAAPGNAPSVWQFYGLGRISGPAETEVLGKSLCWVVSSRWLHACRAAYRKSGSRPERWAVPFPALGDTHPLVPKNLRGRRRRTRTTYAFSLGYVDLAALVDGIGNSLNNLHILQPFLEAGLR
jgi:hypothetical protein